MMAGDGSCFLCRAAGKRWQGRLGGQPLTVADAGIWAHPCAHRLPPGPSAHETRSPAPFQTEASLPDLPFDRIDALIRSKAAELGLDLHNGHRRSTWCKLPDGSEFGAKMGPTGSILYVRAHSRDRLHELRETVEQHLDGSLAGLDPAWSSLDRPGAHPPNFSLARVAGSQRIAADFIRLRLEGDDLGRFARDLIHFRLVLQPQGQARRHGR
ncbi:hypothetical protein ACFSYD_04570 [Paracoccus aerius]